MTVPVKPIPDGYHSVTPYLICRGAVNIQRVRRMLTGMGWVIQAPEVRKASGESGAQWMRMD